MAGRRGVGRQCVWKVGVKGGSLRYVISRSPHTGHTNRLHTHACALQEKEQHSEAQALLERALALCRRTLGSSHPMTATVMNNLGEALARQKRLAEAEPLVRQALEVSLEGGL